jgi:hypothetical protein
VTVTQSEGEADVPTGEITATANEIAKRCIRDGTSVIRWRHQVTDWHVKRHGSQQ